MNVAILTMSLNIGGAETHIYELSCALAAKGHNVTVFSAGGVYADKLTEKGIKHIYTPLNQKDPKSLVRSYRLIEDYVKNNRPCVIHSHTRISNFTADIVSRKYNVPFVSTIHFNFNTGFLQKLCSKWGTRAIAVSEDLRDYAAVNYGFEREKISVTVNGINLDTFSKKDMSDFKTELGIEQDSKVILCVSRLDEVAGDHVEKVLNLSEKIYANNKDTNIIIVGGGTRFSEFSEIAKEINGKTKRNFIRLMGPQTDIYKYCNIADLFIGISRSALEAMACRVPTILLGNSGYIGLFSEKTEPDCIETNFTCRGCPFPADDEIISLISDMLKNPAAYTDNTEAGYETVKNRYSVERMANDAIDAYRKAMEDMRPFDAAICGYYGRENLGDDISLMTITDNLKKECDAKKFLLLTADTSNNPCNIDKCIHRFNLPGIKKHLKRTRAFILGGGSILQDSTSSRSLFYYLVITALAKKAGCAVMLYSNGIGPITKPSHRKNTAKLLEKVNYITLRDKKSLEYIRNMGVKNENVEVTADEVFTAQKDYGKTDRIAEGKRYICINLRSRNCSTEFIGKAAEAIDGFSVKNGFVPVLLPLHFEQDTEALTKLSEKLSCEHVLISEKLPHSETLAVLSSCELAFVQRLHALVFCCIFEIPFIVTNYDPKIRALCEELSFEEYMITPKHTNSQKIRELMEKVLSDKDNIRTVLKEKAKQKRTEAKRNAAVANKVMN